MLHVVRWTIVLLVLLATLGALGWAVAVRITGAMEEPVPAGRSNSVAVEIARPHVGTIRDTRRFTGTLRARSQVDIAPRISGRLARLYVDIGDTVTRGQVIARMDDEEYIQDVEQARADLLVAEATLEEKRSAVGIAERDYQRVQRLREQRIASESELDTAQSRFQSEQAVVRVAEAEVTRRQAALRAAEVRLSYATIVADWEAGGLERVVGERYADEGSTMAANSPLVSLLDLDSMIAVVYVTERDYRPLRIGLAASVTADDEYPGTIVRMAPAFQEGSRQARIEIRVDNPEHMLKPGMFVAATLQLGQADNAMIIPRQALLQREGQHGAFVVDEQTMTARFVPMQIGIRARDRVQVLDPQLDGPVVVLGQHLLSDGATVTIPETQVAAGPDS